MNKNVIYLLFTLVVSFNGSTAIAQYQSENSKILLDAENAQPTDARRAELLNQALRQAKSAKTLVPELSSGATNTTKIDPEKIARQYSEIRNPGNMEKESYELMIFVSTSMPEGSLARVGRDSRLMGAAVVMRGASKGVGPTKWRASIDAIKPLTDNGGEVLLHPDLFTRYGITKVPAVVVAPEAQAGCADDACRDFAVVYGDVTLAYALERLAERRDKVGAIAESRLKKIKR